MKNGGTERLSHLFKVTQLVSDEVVICTHASGSRIHALGCWAGPPCAEGVTLGESLSFSGPHFLMPSEDDHPAPPLRVERLGEQGPLSPARRGLALQRGRQVLITETIQGT